MDARMAANVATTKTSRKPQKRTEITRRRMLDAATEQFAYLGFEAVTIAAIEEAAGVQRGLLVYHWGSKEVLWREVVDQLFAKFYARWDQMMDTIKALPDLDLRSARKLTAHDHYILVGASSFLFSAQQECTRLWGIDPRTEEFAAKHAGLVATLMRQHFGDLTQVP